MAMQCAVLGTCNHQGHPVTRVVVVQTHDVIHPVFFTQLGSDKVSHIKNHPYVSMTIWLPQERRQITWSGQAIALTHEEIQKAWDHYPLDSRQRFMVYGPHSGEPIDSNDYLDDALKTLQQEKCSPPMPSSYVGYRVHASDMRLYQMNTNRISDAWRVANDGSDWVLQRCVP